MRWFLMIPVFWLASNMALGQEHQEGIDFPRYPVPDGIRLKSSVQLPAKVNLATSKFFPSIFDQYGWSCNQSGSIGYLLTYELNRIRNLDGGLPQNRYSPHYAWNFLNSGNYGNGVSYFDSWEIIKAGGAPNEIDYPDKQDLTFWMSGYDRYYRAMQNRVLNNWSLPIGTPADLQVLKRYLYDHFNGSKYGGMANFQIASGGMNIGYLSKNSYDEGAAYITSFGTEVGHCLTVVGYNDSIRLDRNGDGIYTNNIDINGDQIIDLKDYEKGALIVANSWGTSWGDRGFAYVPYNILAYYASEGGLWNKSVHIVEVAKTFEPILALRAELSYSCRNNIRIMAGISNDPNATEPEHILEFPMFNYQGVQAPLYGDKLPDTTRFELGLDISPLADFINTDGPVRIFLIADAKYSSNGNDIVHSMSVYNFFNSRDSVVSDQTRVPIKKNSRTLVSVVRKVRFNRIAIHELPAFFAKPGEYVSAQMEVTGAASPFVWELVPDYQISCTKDTAPDFPEGTLLYNGQFGSPVTSVNLPFNFKFFGKNHDHFSISEDAEILFDQESRDYPYAIDESLVVRSRKKISGFGSDLDYYLKGNAVSWYRNDTIAVIRWKAQAPSDTGGTGVIITCVLHPNGRIRFYYDKPEVLFPDGNALNLGASNGDNSLWRISGFNPDQVVGANCLSINPYLCPDGTKFDETGWLFCRPDSANTLYQIRVRVVDKYRRMAYSTISISTQDMSTARLLSEGYPNPFADETRFRMVVPEKSDILVEIFDIRGSKIAVLCDGEYSAAEYELLWNGTDSRGAKVRPGIYICQIKIGDRRAACKVIKMN